MERDSNKGLELQLLSENLCHEPFIYLKEVWFVLATLRKGIFQGSFSMKNSPVLTTLL